MNSTSNYRPDIDGLRAVAVLLVLLFHLELGIPGGYIGVDVFFVISGYLITGIIHREMERGEFSFIAFYARRARRILPAFIAVLLFSSIAAMFILLPSDLERYAKSLTAAVLSVSNFWFWSQDGYFGSASEMAPLLHTWSLAVEEQFYLVLPIALWVMHRWIPSWTRSLMLLGCVGTFAAAAWFVPVRTSEVFYFSPFRAWELLLGSLLALYRLPTVTTSLHRQWIAVAGLLLILFPAFLYTTETVFPGPAAALPCLGAALLIWVNASGESFVRRLLKSRGLVFVGLISYSLYLWHWPLLVFAKHAAGEHLSLELRLVIGLGSLALAALSWRLIEAPFRSRTQTPPWQAWSCAGASLGLLGALVVAVFTTQGLTGRFSPQVAALDRARARDVIRNECINLRGPLVANTVCRIGASGTPTALVWGDSYAHAMLPAFDTALKQMGVAAWFAAESGCPPLPASRISFRGQDNWRCREFNAKMLGFISAQPALTHVVVSAAWDGYVTESSGFKLRTGEGNNAAVSLARGIETLKQQLGAAHAATELIVVGQVPTYEWGVPLKMAQSQLRGELINPLKRDEWREKSATSRALFEKSVNDGQIAYIQSADWFCAGETCRYANEQDEPLYWDHGHINQTGARFIEAMLERELRSRFSRRSPDAVLP